MRKFFSATCFLVALAATLLASEAAIAADQSIDQFEAAQQRAWNAHDAEDYTAAFDKNAEIVTSQGWNWTGQAEAARDLGDGFKFVYARSQLRLSEVRIRNLTGELVLVALSWSMEGARAIDTGLQAGEQHGFETQLLQRRGESWTILSQQDTAAASSTASARSPEQGAPPASAFPKTAPPVRRCIMARGNGDCLIYGKAK